MTAEAAPAPAGAGGQGDGATAAARGGGAEDGMYTTRSCGTTAPARSSPCPVSGTRSTTFRRATSSRWRRRPIRWLRSTCCNSSVSRGRSLVRSSTSN